MSNLRILFALLVLVTMVRGAEAQTTAHDFNIQKAWPDSKGETMMTMDTSGMAKIWSLQNGKLIFKINKADPDFYVKMIRYKIQHPTMKNAGETFDFEDLDTDSLIYAFKTNDEVVLRFCFKKGTIDGFDRNRILGQVAVFGSVKGDGTVYLVKLVDPATPDKRGVPITKFQYKAEYIHPEFSCKGNWLYDPHNGRILFPITGKVTELDKKYRERNFSDMSWAAEPEEKFVSVAENNERMLVFDVTTGKKIASIAVPKELLKPNMKIYPASDGKSFIYTSVYQQGKKAWLVSEKIVVELVD